MFKFIPILLMPVFLTLCTSVQADVRFAPKLERGAGSSHNTKPVRHRTGQPRSILKKPRSKGLRANLNRTRSLQARKARATTKRVRSPALAHRTKQVRFDTQARRAGSGYNRVRYDGKVAQPKSILKGSRANRAVRSERAFTKRLGASTRATMTHRGQIARHTRKSEHIRSTLSRSGRMAKHSSKLRSAGRLVGGGLAVYGAQQALGVRIPDAFEATEWTYNTLKNPKNAGRRVEKLGRDSVKTVSKGVRTLTNPKKMGRNIDRSLKKTARSINKVGCAASKLLGAKC